MWAFSIFKNSLFQRQYSHIITTQCQTKNDLSYGSRYIILRKTRMQIDRIRQIVCYMQISANFRDAVLPFKI